MTSPEHPRSVYPLSLEVRHESGKFVVSHPGSNIFVEAGTLDNAYRQITELIESHDHASARQDMRSDWGVARVEQQGLMWSLLVLATKSAVVTIVSVAVVTLMGMTTLSLVQSQIKAAIRDSIRLTALVRKVDSIDPAIRAHQQQNLQTVVSFLLPLASAIRPLVEAAMPPPVQLIGAENKFPDSQSHESGKTLASPRLGPAPFEIAKSPKGRLNPE